MEKLAIDGVYKIFGADPIGVLALVREGASKDQILEETGHVIGIRDINLKIEVGETFVVMGLSGSGKSTLIRHINRLIEPTAGKILIDGEDVLQLNPNQLRDLRRHKISMVFQHFGLLPHKTVLENVASGLLIGGVAKREALAQAEEQINIVGLSGFEKSYPRQLSGGMQQRVGLARALATNAEILLMDEAFSALDPLIRHDLQQQLLELQKRLQKTIVFITHDLDEALRIGSQIAMLKDGELRQVGTAEEILLNPADDYVRRFVMDVDRSRVVTMGSIARQDATLLEASADIEVISRALDSSSNEFAILIDDDGRPTGVATIETLRGGGQGYVPATTVPAGSVIEDAMVLAKETSSPVCVVDANGLLVGAASQRIILEAITRPSTTAGP